MKAKLRDWLKAEPFTLAMSSGFFGFYAHCGVLSVLEEEQILPSKVVGSSAGAMIAALWASGLSTDQIQQVICNLKRSDFWDPAFGLGLLRGRLFDQILSEHLPVKTIEECRVPVSIALFDVKQRKTVYANTGKVSDHIRASCAVPLLFHPVQINGRLYLDGGIKDRAGTGGVQSGERMLYHHLVPRSFWRRAEAKSSQVPAHSNMRSFEITDLPRIHPFALDNGQRAFTAAQVTMRTILNKPADLGSHMSLSSGASLY